MSARRLPPQANEWIDRDRPRSFVFEGKRFDAYAGDVLSSALLVNDVAMMARSFKYHRPRGVVSCANHDANVMLTTGERTNVRADVEPIEEGRSYRAVNTVGGLRFDLAQVLQLFSRVLPVGFYYKAFYRPRALFPWWERLIREMAGLGKIDTAAPCVRPPRRNRFCDVLVIGGGVAGLAAARTCVAAGVDVVIADENPHLGGTFDYLHARDPAAQAERAASVAELERSATCEVLVGHYAAGFYADQSVPLVGPEGLVHVLAQQVIVATGLYEQPAVFRNNDLPGVMLASAAQRLVHRFSIAPCTAAVILAGNNEAYSAALDLHAAGVSIIAIVDLDDIAVRGHLVATAMAAGIQVIPQAVVDEARARNGRLAAVVVRPAHGSVTQTIECDGLFMSVGWAPAAGLLYQAGATLEYDPALGQVVPRTLPRDVHVAGRLNGVFDRADQMADGTAAGNAALTALGLQVDAVVAPPRANVPHSHPYPIVAHARGKEFVDFDEDLTIGDLRTAFREGFDSVELMKRYSTIGMGPSQGKLSNMNGVRILARLRGSDVNAIGVTTTRPFTYPVPMGVLAGRRLRRQWHTPMDEIHRALGADVREAGTWLRPMSYMAGSPVVAIEQEYRTVREAVGLIDVSTLGKIEIFGVDAEALLDYAYTCSFEKLRPGMTRYIIMTDGSGTLVDDGVAGRFADDHFYITATSSHAQVVVRQLQLYAIQLRLDVAIVDRTFQVGAVNLAGPASRDVLRGLTDLDLSADEFPYLALREGRVAGVAARVMRVGFVGELGYEIHFPASAGPGIWQALMAAGEAHGIAPFGVEAQRLLRLEKGHLIVGQDTDGTTNPFEANLAWAVRLPKERFVGKHSLALLKPRTARRLVGFITQADPGRSIKECHLIIEHGDIGGRVTSVAYSPHRQAVIGLAMVDAGLADVGRDISIRVSDGSMITASISATPFYDPDNARQAPAESSTGQTA